MPLESQPLASWMIFFAKYLPLIWLMYNIVLHRWPHGFTYFFSLFTSCLGVRTKHVSRTSFDSWSATVEFSFVSVSLQTKRMGKNTNICNLCVFFFYYSGSSLNSSYTSVVDGVRWMMSSFEVNRKLVNVNPITALTINSTMWNRIDPLRTAIFFI